MQIRTIEMEADQTLHLGIFGDLQYGNIGCDEKKAVRFLDKTTTHYPDSRWLLTGDYTDFMSPSNREAFYRASGLYSDTKRAVAFRTLLPIVQETAQLMQPLRGRIDALCQGHHYGYYDWEGIARDKRREYLGTPEDAEVFEHSDLHLAYLLDCKTFVEYAIILRYLWPNGAQYQVLLWHGQGAGQTLAYGLNKIARTVGGWEGLNLVVMGHTHALGSMFASRGSIHPDKDELVEIPVGIVNAGSYLKAYTTEGTAYPEKGMMTPRGLGSPMVHVEPSGDGFEVEIALHAV